MNKLIKFLGVGIAMFSFASCDVIEFPVISEIGGYRTDLYGPPPGFDVVSVPVQSVMLEDFTGHDCGNCPNGHAVAADIQALNPDKVAVVAIHAGSLAAPLLPEYPADWTTPEGQYYLLTQVGVDEMPKGRINRGAGANTVYSYPQWATKVTDALAMTPAVHLQMDASYNVDNNHLNVHVNSQWFQNLTGEYKLVILILESNIVAPQLWYGHIPEYVEDYEHEHMLRGSVSGATGLSVASNPVAGEAQTSSYTFDWNANWIPENCDIVAFVTEGENGKVLNVVKQALVE